MDISFAFNSAILSNRQYTKGQMKEKQMIHWLKTEQQYFQQSWDGVKPFEIRQNDRGYSVGDILILAEGVEKCQAWKAIIARVVSVVPFPSVSEELSNVVVLGLIKLGHIDSTQEQDLTLFEHTLTKVTSVEWTSYHRREKKELSA